VNTIAIIATIVAITLIILYIIRLWLNQLEAKTKIADELVEWLKTSTKSVDEKLTESMKMFNARLDKAAFVIAQVQKNIGEFSEIGRSMQELQEFLQSPKLRGNIGEQVLKELLNQYFPKDSFKLQYSFKNGEKVDAVIKTSQGIIPIDSKFPIENFRRMIAEKDAAAKEKIKKEFIADVKKHIQDIAKKYILVAEGTSDYALMYIPSESVYYEIINSPQLFDFAGQKRVLPVSPMSFYAYMKAILMSFEGQRIQSKAKEILAILQAIRKDYEKTDEALSVLTRHITNAYNQVSTVTKSFLSLGQKVTATRLISEESEQKKLLE
jgi:DNA recombination protein RmuC